MHNLFNKLGLLPWFLISFVSMVSSFIIRGDFPIGGVLLCISIIVLEGLLKFLNHRKAKSISEELETRISNMEAKLATMSLYRK